MKTPDDLRKVIAELNEFRMDKKAKERELKAAKKKVEYYTNCLNVLLGFDDAERSLKAQHAKLKKAYESAKDSYKATLKEVWDSEAGDYVNYPFKLSEFHKETGTTKIFNQLKTLKFLLT